MIAYRSAAIWRNSVDALTAADQADIQSDAAIQIGQGVDRLNLVRQFLDRADPGTEIAVRMGRLSSDTEGDEYAALASSDDVA